MTTQDEGTRPVSAPDTRITPPHRAMLRAATSSPDGFVAPADDVQRQACEQLAASGLFRSVPGRGFTTDGVAVLTPLGAAVALTLRGAS